MYSKLRNILLTYVPSLLKASILCKANFLYNFLEIKPNSCTIMITNRCNLRCVMCKQWRETPGQELSINNWKRIILDLKHNGIRSIHFSGGEPLLRKDLIELVRFSSQNGLVVGATSNGTLLTRVMLAELVDAGLRSIALSMDALGAKYEIIRGMPNAFAQLMAAVEAVSSMKKNKKIDAYINFTLMKDTMKDLKMVKTFADNACLPLAICLLDKNSFLFNLEKNADSLWIREKDDFLALQEALAFLAREKIKNPKSLIINFSAIDFVEPYFKNPRQAQVPCVSSQNRVIIDTFGGLLGGCMSMGRFGNINEKGFDELSASQEYRIAKKNMFYKKCHGCSCGYLFNLRLFLPSVFKNIVAKRRYMINAQG